jgi:8-oxo-dGTP diphosphatase
VPSRPPDRYRIAVDLVILTVREDQLHALLVTRGKPPYRGELALPGGFMRGGEDLDEAAVRELHEETRLDGRLLHLEQLRTYATPGRDPRGHVASVAYLAVAPDLPIPRAGSDAADARWEPIGPAGLPGAPLAFDHETILRDGVERARAKLEYSPLAAAFCTEPFTIGDLRHVYEVVWGIPVDPRNFHRKVTSVQGFILPTGKVRSLPAGRPAALYRKGPATLLHPPMLRPAGAERHSPA